MNRKLAVNRTGDDSETANSLNIQTTCKAGCGASAAKSWLCNRSMTSSGSFSLTIEETRTTKASACCDVISCQSRLPTLIDSQVLVIRSRRNSYDCTLTGEPLPSTS